MKNNEIDCFDSNNGKLIFSKNKVKQPLNKKILLTSLENYFKNNPSIDYSGVTDYIMNSRNITIKEDIKENNYIIFIL